jgi:hypothetical protein
MASKLKLTELLHPDSAVAAITINADNSVTIPTQSTTNLAYTGTLTGGTGVVNIGSGQVYKDASGNVGIGRVPNYKIDAYTSGTGSPAVASSNDNIVTILQSSGSSQGNIGTITSHPLVLLAANAERVRIDTSGNLLVGTTSSGGEIGRLTVKQGVDADNGGLRLIAPNSNNAWAVRTGTDNNLYFSYNSSSKANINQSTGAYTALSDARLKENITNSSNGLSDVLSLRPVSYTFIDDETKTEQLGFIAQEVDLVLPQVVSKPTTSTQYYGLNYSGLTPVLVKAIQEQQALIQDLTTRLTTLEGN